MVNLKKKFLYISYYFLEINGETKVAKWLPAVWKISGSNPGTAFIYDIVALNFRQNT